MSANRISRKTVVSDTKAEEKLGRDKRHAVCVSGREELFRTFSRIEECITGEKVSLEIRSIFRCLFSLPEFSL